MWRRTELLIAGVLFLTILVSVAIKFPAWRNQKERESLAQIYNIWRPTARPGDPAFEALLLSQDGSYQCFFIFDPLKRDDPGLWVEGKWRLERRILKLSPERVDMESQEETERQLTAGEIPKRFEARLRTMFAARSLTLQFEKGASRPKLVAQSPAPEEKLDPIFEGQTIVFEPKGDM